MNSDLLAFWRRLDEHRRRCGLSGRRLSLLAGRGPSWFGQASARAWAVDLPLLYRLARALGCRPADLLPDAAGEALP